MEDYADGIYADLFLIGTESQFKDVTCGSCGSTNVDYREYPWGIKIGETAPTATHCYLDIIVISELDCMDCGYIDEDKIHTGGVQHPTFIQNPANGRYSCPNCNYTIY